jgi:hypothetical protein
LAGLFAGLATSTKYSGGLLPLMILLAHLVAVVRLQRHAVPAHPQAQAPVSTGRRRARHKARRTSHDDTVTPQQRFTLRSFLGGLFGVGTGSLWRHLLFAALLCITTVLLTSPYILLDWDAFETGFRYERTHMQTGHFGLDETSAVLWYARVMTEQILGWPLSILALLGFGWVVMRQRRAWAAILSIFPFVYVLILSSWSMKAARYILPVLPVAHAEPASRRPCAGDVARAPPALEASSPPI